MPRLPVLLLAAACLPPPAMAELRSRAVRTEFVRLNPCPATGRTAGACPGWEVDHVAPLCLTGPAGDTIGNLEWRTVEEHRRKTREDVRLCRAARR